MKNSKKIGEVAIRWSEEGVKVINIEPFYYANLYHREKFANSKKKDRENGIFVKFTDLGMERLLPSEGHKLSAYE